MSYGTVAPTHAIKASELDQGRSALPSRAKQEPPHARSHRRSRHPYRGPDEWATSACGKIGAQPSASAHPPTRRRWTVTAPGPRLSSEELSAGLHLRRGGCVAARCARAARLTEVCGRVKGTIRAVRVKLTGGLPPVARIAVT